MNNHDVIIVGAGVAGLTLALDCLRAGLSVAVIEAREDTAPEAGRHVRVSAINLASERILTRLGVWESIDPSARSPFREIAVWDAEGGAVDFSYRDVGSAHLGHIVANHAIVIALLAAAKACENFTWLCPSELSTFDVQTTGVVIKLIDGAAHHCQLLVAADGANSWVRNTLKIPMVSAAYEQTAIVVTVQTEQLHGATARQHFLQTGPLAFLPLKDPNTCSIVWSTTPEHAVTLMQMTVPDLSHALTEGLQSRLGAVTVAEQPQSFPLKMHHVNHYVHPRVALIGDAAHTLHPLAGQGMNLGILDAACLGQVIKSTKKLGRDFGRIENLRRYERWRRGDNQMMIDAMAFFKQGFAADRGLLKQIRDVSLRITQNSQWLRRVFMRHAMGLRGDLPDLAKGF